MKASHRLLSVLLSIEFNRWRSPFGIENYLKIAKVSSTFGSYSASFVYLHSLFWWNFLLRTKWKFDRSSKECDVNILGVHSLVNIKAPLLERKRQNVRQAWWIPSDSNMLKLLQVVLHNESRLSVCWSSWAHENSIFKKNAHNLGHRAGREMRPPREEQRRGAWHG